MLLSIQSSLKTPAHATNTDNFLLIMSLYLLRLSSIMKVKAKTQIVYSI